MNSDWNLPYPSRRQPVLARNAVATSEPLAVHAGIAMLQRGGNAVDAALTAGVALTVVEPCSNGIGSDLFAIVWVGRVLIGLNASGVYPAYYCSPTQAMTEERAANHFFPSFNLYVICAGIVSEGQLESEERVLKEIAEENGGLFLSRDYKPEVLEALSPWNLDCIRNVCGYRMNRRMYAGGSLPSGPPEVALYHSRVWRESLERFGETHITDRGGADTTTFIYGIEPSGRYTLSVSTPITPK